EPDTGYLLRLSRERAATVQALICGDGDEFAYLCHHSHTVEDYQQILTFIAVTRRWPCDPRGIDGQHGPSTTRPIAGFQVAFNREESPSTALHEDGVLDEATWKAFFVCNERELANALGTDAAGLSSLRRSMQFLSPKAVGCGNFHPVQTGQYVSTSN